MKFVVCVVLVIIFVNTIKALKSKQVNLALETVLNFDKKDRKADLAVIDKVQNFLDQIKDAMRRGSARRNAKHDVTFTDFILEATKILKEYDDNDLEDAYVIINDEARKYINTVSAFKDLFGSNDIRRFVSDQLDDAKEMPADKLRHSLDLAIEFIETQKKYGGSNDILDIGNTLYDGASDKFVDALRNLYKLRRAGSYNLERLLKDTLRSLVFDHYSNLDNRVRGELVNMVKHYWRAFSKKKGKHTRTKLRMPDATPFRHEGKRHKHRTNSPTERTHKPDKFQDESSVSHEKYIKNTHKNKHEVFLTDNELNKLINKADAPNEEKPEHSYSIQKDNKPYINPEAKKISSNKHKIGRAKSSPQLYRGTAKKHDRTEDREIIKSDLSGSSEPEVLMGGQTIRDIHFRGQGSSKQDEGSDRTGEETSAEEIVIQHSNIVDIGLSRKTPGRINITFVSSETNKNDGSNEKISKESISYKVMRKSNANDTLETDPNPRDYKNVDMLLKKIEKAIEDVKDQVEYVKNITNIRRRDNVEHLSSEITRNITGAKAPKTDSGFAFRTQDDSDFTNSSSELEHDSEKEVTENTTIVTDSTDTNTKTESKISEAVENSSASNINNNQNSNKSIEQKEEDTSQAHDANKDNATNDSNTTNNAELNKNDNDEHKDEDHENTLIEDHENTIIESNLSSTAKVSLDLNIN